MSRDINNSVRDNLYANFYGEIVFLKDFKFTANFTLDNVYRMDTFYYNNEYGTAATSTNNGLVEKYNDNYFSYNTQQMLNWNKTIKEHHNFDVLIGHEFGKTDQRVVDAYKKNIFYPGIPELGNAVSQYSNGSTSSTVVTAIEGYFARVNYNYAGKYFFSGFVPLRRIVALQVRQVGPLLVCGRRMAYQGRELHGQRYVGRRTETARQLRCGRQPAFGFVSLHQPLDDRGNQRPDRHYASQHG